MKKCFYCGKLKNLKLVDEEEEIYLCIDCLKKERKELKERLNHARSVFEESKKMKRVDESKLSSFRMYIQSFMLIFLMINYVLFLLGFNVHDGRILFNILIISLVLTIYMSRLLGKLFDKISRMPKTNAIKNVLIIIAWVVGSIIIILLVYSIIQTILQ